MLAVLAIPVYPRCISRCSDPSTPPRIAIDLRLVDAPGMEHSGVGRYAIEIAEALAEARPDWHLISFSNRPKLVRGEAFRTRLPTATSAGRVLWVHAGSAACREARRADLWFSPGFVTPLWWRGPSVVTIHDLVFALDAKRYRGRLNAAYASRATRMSARRASRVLCGSHETKDRLVEHIGVEPERVVVTPYGVTKPFLKNPVFDPSSREDFLLFVGVFEARKGLETLLAALRKLKQAGRPVKLVLAGRAGWGTEDVLNQLRAEPDVQFEEQPSDERLADLYRRALALVYPSHMEGFGFPVAEAMASGCPVVASDLACIREFAHDAPLYVPAGDAVALAAQLMQLIDRPSVQAGCAAEGLKAAAKLGWDHTGESTAQAIEAAMNGGDTCPAVAKHA